MDLLQQCQQWTEQDEFRKIIDAIEALPDDERTPELDSELARAYSNAATVDDRDMLKHALELLKPHEAYFQGDHRWNFRMAYAYFYLEQEHRALPYFEKALEARPGDEDTEEFIERCRRYASLPVFRSSFRDRTAKAWESFAEAEADLRKALADDKTHENAHAIVERFGEIFEIAFDDVAFEIGVNEHRHEVILSPQGDKVKLFELVYFREHAPASVLENWSILVGRQRAKDAGLRTEDIDISGSDVRVRVEKTGEGRISLKAYCEKLLPVLENEEGKAYWAVATLIDQILGEIPHMRFVDSLEVLDRPLAEPGMLLEDLPAKLEADGFDLDPDPARYLDTALCYQCKPSEDPDADWRLDVMAGSTTCPALINDYLGGETDFTDALLDDGAVAGFFIYPLDGFFGEDQSERIFNFRDRLEEALSKGDGPELATLTGGATGTACGYVDFIAWDMRAFIEKAKAFFDASPVEWANFHVFRRDAGTIALKTPRGTDPEDDPDDEPEGDPNVKSDEEERSETSQTSEKDAMDATDATDEPGCGPFLGFALLSKARWDKAQLVRDLKDLWDITVPEPDPDEEERDDALVFNLGERLVALSLMPFPIPDHEAEKNAENNWMWPEAVEVAKKHAAHVMVAVCGGDDDPIERGKLFVKLMDACSRQRDVTGIYTSGVVFDPDFYRKAAEAMNDDALPVHAWIWFGLYAEDGGLRAYTYGMESFGRREIEVLDADGVDARELWGFIFSMASYVLECGQTLEDGQTIGFSEDDKHAITLSEGAALPGMTLKIAYGNGMPEA